MASRWALSESHQPNYTQKWRDHLKKDKNFDKIEK